MKTAVFSLILGLLLPLAAHGRQDPLRHLRTGRDSTAATTLKAGKRTLPPLSGTYARERQQLKWR